MLLAPLPIRDRERLDPVALDAARRLYLLHPAGRLARAELPAHWLSLWLPLRGALRLQCEDGAWELRRGRSQLWRGALHAGGGRDARWLAVAGPEPAWAPHLQAAGAEHLFAHEDAAGLLRRAALALARAGEAARAPDLARLCAALLEQQRDVQDRLPHCPGRTPLRRRQSMQRLLRVRHLIRCRGDMRLDLAALARRANCSPGHLQRAHRQVFGDTPSEYAARLRCERAWRLVRDTALPIGAIVEALGFEGHAAFSRSFKAAFGATAGEVRRSARASLPAWGRP
ncbi:helix-turn-helix domain-containing protein [Vulcaniibacterium tengchongense]|uniref:AraC family transcriptional regulator n=1 Tax=Vulcaniibacterium tengchongense TaxID=1273429 RepID=A0A3N4V745_9GAMM|nr:AraC family transcriptional regulator [Vulcaniibacterium tengchongense]RPE75521.1 AraC family transcriptional regulator [Vulcaniibacterium tengchongense]